MESVCTVQSDKAAVEITSRYTGVVKKLYVKEGETVKIGGPLMDIDTVDEVPDDTPNNISSNLNDSKRHYSSVPQSKVFTHPPIYSLMLLITISFDNINSTYLFL